MAFITTDDKQNPNPNQAQQGQGAQGGAAPVGGSSGGGAVAGSDVGTSTQPTSVSSSPNAGGWTNIQSYLMANQGNTGSADALNKQVGSSFDQDKQSLNDQSTQAKSAADQQVAGQVGTDAASQMISQMGNQYSYSGPQAQGYQDAKTKLQGTLGGTWTDPSYAPAMSGQSQQYGTSLVDPNSFGGMMNGIYNQAGVTSAGGLALQQQLDNSNSAVQSARQGLLNQYGGLRGEFDVNNASGTAGQTQAAIQGDQTQFGNNKGALLSYLQGAGTQDRGQIDSAVGSTNKLLNSVAQNFNQNYNDPRYRHTATAAVQPGSLADATNVSGVDPQRNQYNSIMDVLGMGGQQIGRAQTALDPLNVALNGSLYTNPDGSAMTIGQMLSADPSKYDQAPTLFLDPSIVTQLKGTGGMPQPGQTFETTQPPGAGGHSFIG